MSEEKEEFQGMGLGVLQHLEETAGEEGANKGNWKGHDVRRELRGNAVKERKRGSNSVKYCIGLVS